MKESKNLSPETQAARAMHDPDPHSGAVNPPIALSSTFARDADYQLRHGQQGYGRDDNPGYVVAERLLAELEGGEDAMLFSSGMASAAAVIQCLRPGQRVVAPRIMYWGLRNWMSEFCADWGLELDWFEPGDSASLEAVVKAKPTRLVWIETPCNPSWDVIDIGHAARVAHHAGGMLAVDSTAATPVLTQPLSLGADLVMHSATKYLNGHSDAVAGALVTAQCDDFWNRLMKLRTQGGAICGSLESYLLQRGMRTLFLRVRKASQSALAIAQQLQRHDQVEQVFYPGLTDHPGHAVACQQMNGGFGGMLTIKVRGGRQAALNVVKSLRLFIPATSFGGVESLAEHRYTVEGEDSPVPSDWIRLSVGIEAVEDLVFDLEQALSKS